MTPPHDPTPTPELHHVVLGAAQIELLAEFYREAVGLPEIRRQFHEDESVRSIWLQLGQGLLMIESAQTLRGPRADREAGWCLVCFRISEPAVESTRTRWLAAGATEDGETQYTHYFRDPEGHRIGFSTYSM